MSLLLTLLFLGISICMSILAGYISNLLIEKKINRQYVFFGMGIFFVGIAFHSLLALPVVISAHGFKIFTGLHDSSDLSFSLLELLYFALAAGLGQEISKAMPIWFELKRTSKETPAIPYYGLGLSIGLGFSLSEILIIGINSWQPDMPGLSFSNVFIGSFERLSGTLFHLATGLLIVYGIEKGKTKWLLPFCIFLHTIVDFSAGYFDKYPMLSLEVQELFLFIFSSVLLGSSIIFVKKTK